MTDFTPQCSASSATVISLPALVIRIPITTLSVVLAGAGIW
jgi:hypothetical protein